MITNSNISGIIDVKWKRPQVVYKQIDRYIIRWTVSGPSDYKLYDEVTVINNNMMKQQQQVSFHFLLCSRVLAMSFQHY